MARRPTSRTAAPPAPEGMLFAVTRSRGPAWNSEATLEGQEGWAEHAQFMSALEAAQVVVAGGPLEDTPYVLLAMRGENAQVVRAKLSGDPWESARIIETTRIAPWTLRLGVGRI